MTDQPTPDSARVFVKTLADLYGDAVLALLGQIADRVNRGLTVDQQRAKLDDLLTLRRQAQGIADHVSTLLDQTLAQIVADAYEHGVGQAASDLATVVGLPEQDRATDALVQTKASTVEGLAKALAGHLRRMPIVRATEDIYRTVISQSVAPAAAGVETRRAAAQRALDRFAMTGVTGFRDESGRNWTLESYAEMSTRTTVAHASLQGSLDRIQQTTPFVRVSDVADECELCRPWEGRILLVDGAKVPDEWSRLTAKTVSEATRGGLFHPNCTHSIGAYVPGLTRHREAHSNARGYEDRQRQRAIERNLRQWKRREAVALDPAAKAKARGKVQAWSAALAEHTTETNRLRVRARESITSGR